MFGMDQPLFKILNEIRLKEHAMMLKNPIASQNVIVKSGESKCYALLRISHIFIVVELVLIDLKYISFELRSKWK
jgi:hypothetical protein